MLSRFVVLLWIVATSVVAASSIAAPGRAQNLAATTTADRAAGTCLGCHDGSRSSGTLEHLAEWRRSIHQSRGVACTACHGGDASALTIAQAHPEHLNSADPMAATNVRNLNRTCGACHQQITTRDEQNPHYKLTLRGDRLAPNCVTCHGEVAADPPLPARVQAGCDGCHGARAPIARPEYGATARLSIVSQVLIRRQVQEMHAVLAPLPGETRNGFMLDLGRITEAVRAAVVEGHGGNMAGMGARLEAAGHESSALMAKLTAYLKPAPKPKVQPETSGRGYPQVAFAASDQTAAPSAQGCDQAAKPARLDFVVKDMNGLDIRFADFKGRVILLNFWATWCGPCKAEIPWLVDLQAKYGSAGLQVLGFSVDDPPEKMKPYAAEYQINYPLLQGLGHDDVQEAYGPIWGVPMTFLISRDGRVCRTYRGITSKERIERDTKALL